MDDCKVSYKSYILRFWQDSPQSSWRATVQSIQSQETTHFADLDALFVYLATQTVQSYIAECLPSIQDDME